MDHIGLIFALLAVFGCPALVCVLVWRWFKNVDFRGYVDPPPKGAYYDVDEDRIVEGKE